MGRCTYCGKAAGLFKNTHKECKFANEAGRAAIPPLVSRAIYEGTDLSSLEQNVNVIASDSYITELELAQFYSLGFDSSIDLFLEDGLISADDEAKIMRFKNYFSNLELTGRDSFQKLTKALVLRDLLENKLPARINISGNVPFLLQKGETIIWIFQDVECFEQRIKTVYEGRSQGVSIRIAKGIYYRTGSFRGNPVQIEHAVSLGGGILAFTNMNLYFSSTSKTFRIPYKKLISVTPYSDGLGLQKDGATAKPQIFKPLDGWFAYNLVSNLIRL